MADTLAEFIAGFVVPLHRGGELHVSRPFSLRDRDQMHLELGALADDDLRLARNARAQSFVSVDDLPDPTTQELSGWLGLYNVLALDHPQAERVWTRETTWELAAQTTRALLAESTPVDEDGMLARHLAVEAFLDAKRVDVVARIGEGERRFTGMSAPRAVRRLAGAGQADVYEETVTWVDQPHTARVEALIPMVMRSSPLTSLIRPRRAAAGWDPAPASVFLRRPSTARAVVYAWARDREWVAIGGEVTAALLRALRGAQPVHAEADHDLAWREILEDEAAARGVVSDRALAPPPLDAGDAAALVGGLIHLHLLRVLSFDARVALAGHRRRGRMRAFLTLPLLLPQLVETLGDPLVGVEDPSLLRRWDEYLEGLRGLVPRPWVDDLARSLVVPVREGVAA
jgi:hypothetical protein